MTKIRKKMKSVIYVLALFLVTFILSFCFVSDAKAKSLLAENVDAILAGCTKYPGACTEGCQSVWPSTGYCLLCHSCNIDIFSIGIGTGGTCP